MSPSTFSPHPQLLHDCHHLCVIEHFHVLLHKNASIPWLILVPETTVREIHHMPLSMHKTFLRLATHISDFCEDKYQAEKMNIAALGNVVDQLHIHVIARHSSDPCWPDVVWGRDYAMKHYDQQHIDELIESFHRLMHREVIS